MSKRKALSNFAWGHTDASLCGSTNAGVCARRQHRPNRLLQPCCKTRCSWRQCAPRCASALPPTQSWPPCCWQHLAVAPAACTCSHHHWMANRKVKPQVNVLIYKSSALSLHVGLPANCQLCTCSISPGRAVTLRDRPQSRCRRVLPVEQLHANEVALAIDAPAQQWLPPIDACTACVRQLCTRLQDSGVWCWPCLKIKNQVSLGKVVPAANSISMSAGCCFSPALAHQQYGMSMRNVCSGASQGAVTGALLLPRLPMGLALMTQQRTYEALASVARTLGRLAACAGKAARCMQWFVEALGYACYCSRSAMLFASDKCAWRCGL